MIFLSCKQILVRFRSTKATVPFAQVNELLSTNSHTKHSRNLNDTEISENLQRIDQQLNYLKQKRRESGHHSKQYVPSEKCKQSSAQHRLFERERHHVKATRPSIHIPKKPIIRDWGAFTYKQNSMPTNKPISSTMNQKFVNNYQKFEGNRKAVSNNVSLDASAASLKTSFSKKASTRNYNIKEYHDRMKVAARNIQHAPPIPRLNSRSIFRKTAKETQNLKASAANSFIPNNDPMFDESLADDVNAGRQIVEGPNSDLIVRASFADIGVPQQLITRLLQMGITHPTDIQLSAIGYIFSKRDILVRSETGSGKSFGVLIALLSTERRPIAVDRVPFVRKIVIVPSAHLASQMYEWATAMLGFDKTDNRLESTVKLIVPNEDLLFNDTTAVRQQSNIASIPEILITTSTALSRVIETKAYDLSHVTTIYIDEADLVIKSLKVHATIKDRKKRAAHPVLALTVLKHLLKISTLASKPQVIISSATINYVTKTELVIENIVERPILVNVGIPFSMPTVISNQYYILDNAKTAEDEKSAVIDGILSIAKRENGQGIVFIDSTASKSKLQAMLYSADPKITTQYLSQHTFVASQPTDVSSIESPAKMPAFYIASDSDARGIHIPDLKWVLMIGLPKSVNDYLHMAGRVGRQGKPGKAIVMIRSKDELQKLQPAFRLLKFSITEYGNVIEDNEIKQKPVSD